MTDRQPPPDARTVNPGQAVTYHVTDATMRFERLGRTPGRADALEAACRRFVGARNPDEDHAARKAIIAALELPKADAPDLANITARLDALDMGSPALISMVNVIARLERLETVVGEAVFFADRIKSGEARSLSEAVSTLTERLALLEQPISSEPLQTPHSNVSLVALVEKLPLDATAFHAAAGTLQQEIVDSVKYAIGESPPPGAPILRRIYRSSDLARIPPGLYSLTWKIGGTALAAVGMYRDGRRWFAPTSWVGEHVPSQDWGLVESAEEVRR